MRFAAPPPCCNTIPFLMLVSPVFREAGKFEKAMLAYEKALDWQELFDVAGQQQCPEDDVVATAYRVAGWCQYGNLTYTWLTGGCRGFVVQEAISRVSPRSIGLRQGRARGSDIPCTGESLLRGSPHRTSPSRSSSHFGADSCRIDHFQLSLRPFGRNCVSGSSGHPSPDC